MPLDACRWTPKGETSGLSALYIQKAYQFDLGDIVSVFCVSKRACLRVPLDACRWTPKGETTGLSTLYVQKAYEFDIGDTVSVFFKF